MWSPYHCFRQPGSVYLLAGHSPEGLQDSVQLGLRENAVDQGEHGIGFAGRNHDRGFGGADAGAWTLSTESQKSRLVAGDRHLQL